MSRLALDPRMQQALRRVLLRAADAVPDIKLPSNLVTTPEMDAAIDDAVTQLTDDLVNIILPLLYQPLSTGLSSLAASGEAVGGGNDYLIYWDDTNFANNLQLSAFMKSFIEDNSTASGARSSLELGTLATEDTVAGTSCTLNSAGWTGVLNGSGVTNAQQLADWIDANIAP